MRKLILLFLLIAPSAWADCKSSANSLPLTFASEKITVSSTAIGFTAATAAGALRAYCSIETDQVRFLIQKLPTATTGILVSTGSYFEVCADDIPRFLMIRVTNDATANCIYQR